MAWTQTDETRLSNLKAIRARGVRSVTFGDRRTDFQSAEELDSAIALLETQKANSATPPRPRRYLCYLKKGL
jgi:hypothetical protein